MVPRVEVGWLTAQLGGGMGNWIRERKEQGLQGTELPRCQPELSRPPPTCTAGASSSPLDSERGSLGVAEVGR